MQLKTVLVHDELMKRMKSSSRYSLAATVHSVFERAVNFHVGGELWTVAPYEIGQGPMGILVPDPEFARWRAHCNPNDAYTISEGGLRKPGSHLSSLDWLGRILEYTLPTPEVLPGSAHLKQNLQTLDQLLRTYMPVARSPLEKGIAEQIATFCQSLLLPRNVPNWDGIKRHLESGIGMGFGLTPTADDIVVGWMAVIAAEGSPWKTDARSALRFVADSAHEKTTDVSVQMLDAAANGYYKKAVVDLVQNMQVRGVTIDDFAEVLRIGHSSGMDMLRGIQLGFQSLLQRRNEWQ